MKKKLKALFLTPTSLRKYNGIEKKVLFQYEALKKNNLDIELCFLDRDERLGIARKIYREDKIENKVLKNFKTRNNYIKKLFSIFFYWNFSDVFNYILENKIKLIYIRYEYASNYGFIKFLKKLKEKKIMILIEIPTYPYDQELLRSSLRVKIKYFVDKYYRNYLHKYVHRIITFSNDDEIYGIKTIKISNGIDINKIPLITREKLVKEINFIGVAGLALWHGFDRFILSMSEYYKNNPKEIIKFHIVGSSSKEIMEELKKLVKNNNLNDYVIFYGYKSGKDLDNIYNQTDIAIGSLGIHRIGLTEVQPLKNREYCAKGLPFVISFNDPCFENKDFVFKVSNNEELFDINEIIDWYKNLKISPKEIREYSKQFTWNIQMGKVVKYLEDKN